MIAQESSQDMQVTRRSMSRCLSCYAGDQKSSQDRKEAHKAKRKAKKGEDAANGPSALTAAPTAEALAAVGATQLSKAAQERRRELDRSKAAANGASQSSTAEPAVERNSGATAETSGGQKGRAHAVPAGRAWDEAEEVEVSAESSSEGEEAQLDSAGGAEVCTSARVDCSMCRRIRHKTCLPSSASFIGVAVGDAQEYTHWD